MGFFDQDEGKYHRQSIEEEERETQAIEEKEMVKKEKRKQIEDKEK